MPEFFKEWLKSLSVEQADELDLWLDSQGGGNVREEVINVIIEAYPDFFDQVVKL